MSSGIKFGAIMSAQQQLVNRKDKAMSRLEWGRTCTYTADMLPNFTPRELRAQCTKNKLSSTGSPIELRTRLAEHLLVERTRTNEYRTHIAAGQSKQVTDRCVQRCHRAWHCR